MNNGDLCFLHAKRLIALFWKKTSRPKYSTVGETDAITYILNGKQDMFEKIWGQFITFMKYVDLIDDQVEEK